MTLTLVLLLACGDNDGATGDTGPQPEPRPEPPAYSEGTCPELFDGSFDDFPTGGTSYDLKIVLPPDPQGAPVIFAWHWLGGTASQIISQMDLDDLAAEQNVIIIAPNAGGGSVFDWNFLAEAEGNPDLTLFDDLLSCARQQWGIDLDRVYSMGMSAGGLQTSYLTIHRAEWHAATAPLSGGVVDGFYITPDWPLPVLLTWGGESDNSNGLSFHDAALLLSQELRDDGSFVIECEHTGGHSIPNGATEYIWQFFADHPMGVDPEPYADGLPDSFPTWCSIP